MHLCRQLDLVKVFNIAFQTGGTQESQSRVFRTKIVPELGHGSG